MKVKCIKTESNIDGRTYKSLIPGKEYPVLTLDISLKRRIDIRIIENENQDSFNLYPIDLFEVSDGSLPVDWEIKINDEKEFIEVGPKRLLENGFWEEYYEFADSRKPIYQEMKGVIKSLLVEDQNKILLQEINKILDLLEAYNDEKVETNVFVSEFKKVYENFQQELNSEIKELISYIDAAIKDEDEYDNIKTFKEYLRPVVQAITLDLYKYSRKNFSITK